MNLAHLDNVILTKKDGLDEEDTSKLFFRENLF
jgi:hypothetical protein